MFSTNQLVLPKNLQVIDVSFLYECKSFDKPIIIHENIEKIRDHFMYKCSNFTNLIINCNQENFVSCNYTCGTVNDSDICYTKGIIVSGSHAQEFVEKFKNSDEKDTTLGKVYRKLICA